MLVTTRLIPVELRGISQVLQENAATLLEAIVISMNLIQVCKGPNDLVRVR